MVETTRNINECLMGVVLLTTESTRKVKVVCFAVGHPGSSLSVHLPYCRRQTGYNNAATLHERLVLSDKGTQPMVTK